MMQPRSARSAVLLDGMGTLVGLEPPAPRLCAAVWAGTGIELSRAAAERALAAEIRFYRAHLGEGRDDASVAALRTRCAEVLIGALPGPVAAAVAPEARVQLLRAALHFFAFPDARPALERLREEGCRLVVASNWDASLPLVLAEVGLAPLLDAVVTSARAGAAKPAPAVFRRALALAGVPATAALHAGDSLDEDVAGARAAGIAAIWVNRTGAPVPAGVDAIGDLAGLLAPGRRRRP